MIAGTRQSPVVAADAPAGAGRTAPAVRAIPRPAPRRQHQGLVVIDRLWQRREGSLPEFLPAGWTWVLANSSLAEVHEQLLASAGIDWSATILPEEQYDTFSTLGAAAASRRVIPYGADCCLDPKLLSELDPDGNRLYLVTNGHQFPMCDLGRAMALHRQNRCDATLIELMDPNSKAYDEAVMVGLDGQVCRVDRVYERLTQESAGRERGWPAVLVLSQYAMERMASMALPPRMCQWPAAMLRMGLRLQGETMAGRCFDLHQRQELHDLATTILRERPQWLCSQGRLTERRPKLWTGRDVSIDPKARIIGPAAVGDGARVEAGAVILGPAVIGRGARVGSGVVLRRSLVLPDTNVQPETLKQPGVVPVDHAAADPVHPVPTPQRLVRLEKVMEASRAGRAGKAQYWGYRAAKRALDIIGAGLVLLLTLPFYPFIALAILINSPGRILYGHVRQGRGGVNFRCWKFRTMVPDADLIKPDLLMNNEVDGPQFKMRRDPRIFAVGRWLRRFNVDEWPQMFNVLIGQMSLVGPRPSPERENRMCPAWREARLSVRPGVTGLWQVCRRREVETDFQEWIYYDVQYIKRQSLWLDLKILARTLRVMLKGN